MNYILLIAKMIVNMKDIFKQLSEGVSSDEMIDTLYTEYNDKYQESIKDKK